MKWKGLLSDGIEKLTVMNEIFSEWYSGLMANF